MQYETLYNSHVSNGRQPNKNSGHHNIGTKMMWLLTSLTELYILFRCLFLRIASDKNQIVSIPNAVSDL